MLRYYPAIVDKEPGSDFGVSFPDFPGCISAGTTQSEALVMAKEAVALHVEGLLADDEPLPVPTSIEDLPNSFVALIEVALPGPSKRINISLEESLLGEIDAAAGILGTSRSAFLGDAARSKLDEVFHRRLGAALDQTGGMVEAVRRVANEDS